MEAMQPERDLVESCALACGNCSRTCLKQVRHCLEIGGDDEDPAHVAMLLTCANVCRTAAELMAINSEWYPTLCDLCAQVSEECADACATMDQMEVCVTACRQCAQACRIMVSDMTAEDGSAEQSQDSEAIETMN